MKDGVHWVKVEASGTGFNPLCPAERDTISAEELAAVVNEASDKGKPVACHAESRNAIIKAARAGVRTVEHAIYLDDEGLEAVLEHEVAICPTLGLYTAYAAHGLEFGIPIEIVTNHRRTHERHVEAIRKAYEAGVTIIAGSDSGLTNFPQRPRHARAGQARRPDRARRESARADPRDHRAGHRRGGAAGGRGRLGQPGAGGRRYAGMSEWSFSSWSVSGGM